MEEQRHLQPHQRCGAAPQGLHVEAQGDRSNNSSVTYIDRSPFGSLNTYGAHCRDPFYQERTPSDPRGYSAEELEENRRQIKILEAEIKEMERDRKQKEKEIEVMRTNFLSNLNNIKKKWSQGFAEILAIEKCIDPRPGSRAPPSDEPRVPFEGRVPAFARIAPPASPSPMKGAYTAPPTASTTKSTWRRGRLAEPPILLPLRRLLREASERRTREIVAAAEKAAQHVKPSSEADKVADQPPTHIIEEKTRSPERPEPARSVTPMPERTRRRKKRLRIAQPPDSLIKAASDKMKLKVSIPIRITDEDKENYYIQPVPREAPVLPPEEHTDWWLF